MVATLAFGVPASAQAQQCANSDVAPQASNLGDVRAAVLCLVNSERNARGLAPFRAQAQLARAAAGHAEDMVRREYFAHVTPDGVELRDRVAAARYLPRRGWALAENLAWGTGSLSTPRGIVDAWMASPGHKSIMLSRRYRDAGIGIAIGNPRGTDAGATVALNVGKRPAKARGARKARAALERR